MIFFFSATGNSRWVARRLAEATGERLTDMAEALHKRLTGYPVAPDEKIGFVTPVYGWDVPPVVETFIKRLELENYSGNYIYLAATCGDDTGRMWQQFSRLLRRKGWHPYFGQAITMPNTYVCLPGFDTDSPSVTDEKLERSTASVDAIRRRIESLSEGSGDMLPGHLPWLKTYVLGKLFRHFLLTDRPFHTGTSCTGCGRCAHLCPLGNISMEQGHPHWRGKCTGCLCCYHHCPKHAIRWGLSTLHKGQYYWEKCQHQKK